jgi:UDP-2-acetamido-3-amino-2,3-dideoxy-glucuronate N-acetyltransferase
MEKSRDCDLALIGAGHWGRNLARNYRALNALHTLCDANPRTLESFDAEYSGVRKLTDADRAICDPDVRKVVIATPAALHYRLARSALLAGKDVFVEKPLCLSEAEAEELISLAHQRQLVLMVGHLLQYHPCVEALRLLIQNGDLGQLYYIASNRLNLGKIRHEENALWSFAPHDVSVILSLVGDRLPARVRCSGASYLRSGIADTTLTVLEFDNRVRAHVYVSWLNPFKEQKLTVVGSKGMAVFDDTRIWPEKLLLFRDYLTWSSSNVPTPNSSSGRMVTVPETEPLHAECQHFLARCHDRTPPLTDGHEGLRVLRVLQASQRSLDASGNSVSL